MNATKGKNILIIGAICVAVGLVVFFVGFSLGKFNLANISSNSDSDFQKKEYVASKDIKSLDLKDSDMRIDVVPSEDEAIHITYYESEHKQYIIDESKEKLSVGIKEDNNWFVFIGFNFSTFDHSVTIAVPKNYKGDLDIKTNNGKIEASSISGKNVRLENSNGRINISGLDIKGNLEAETSNATVEIDNSTIKGSSINKSDNGKIQITDIEAGDVFANTNNGRIEFNNLSSSGEIDAKTSNGKIIFDNLKFKKGFTANNSNGAIVGTIVGKMTDFTIDSRTSNSSSNLPESLEAGNKLLNIKTSNGKINIDFIK